VNPAHIREGTQKENLQDMYAKGRNRDDKGEKHPRAKLSGQQVCEIRAEVARGVKRSQVARLYGLSWNHVKMIADRTTWGHLECA
jgi:DNA-binding transcriptional regulator YiaG